MAVLVSITSGSVMQGIATMVLESPFYGSRKPQYQFASQLQRVSDLLILGRSTIEESLCLLDWAGRHTFTSLGEQQPFPATCRTEYCLNDAAKFLHNLLP